MSPTLASRCIEAMARVSPAMSRTAVMPPSSARQSRRSARGRESSPDTSLPTWTWVSISPGMTNLPGNARTVAPVGNA